MLRGLFIRDMLLIERLELEFQPGLNVLTGETGAGKSILLDALGFVLGWRTRASPVRSGADAGEVTATFDIGSDHPIRPILTEAGIPIEAEVILRRTAHADGRRQAWANDRRCSVETLRQISETLVEIHGQQDDRGLMNPRGHRALLDDFAGNSRNLAQCRKLWGEWQARQTELAKAQTAADRAAADRDYLAHAVQELDQLAPKPGEDATLDTSRRLMQAGERIRADIGKAADALGPQGVEGLANDAVKWLRQVSEQAEGRLDAPLEALLRATDEIDQAQRGIVDCLTALAFDPRELENIEERLFAIRALARKHGVAPDELSVLGDRLRERLAAIDDASAGFAALKKTVAEAGAAHDAIAADLARRRRSAAGRLDQAIATELAPLKLERAVFRTDVRDENPGPDGSDAVQFTIATNPGAAPGPLNKIASGGELSRLLLALKVSLRAHAPGLTMIFDEIDRGVGGATADAVGRRLASLAEGSQVLVVTHSPQVAARGNHHWQVEKQVQGGTTRSQVHAIDAQARVSEIARMLAGDVVTDEARAAAGKLLGVSG